jgi:hypothetical protein
LQRVVPLPPSGGDPDWLRHELRAALAVLAGFFRTASAFTRRPRAFAADFAAGAGGAQNPITFLATSGTLVTAVHIITDTVLGNEQRSSLADEIGKALGPYLYFVALGALIHALLRIRSPRPLRSSVAIALFAGGGPAAALGMFLLVLGTALKLTVADRTAPGVMAGVPPVLTGVVTVVVVAALASYHVIFALGMAGLHGVKRRWAGLALLLAVVALAFIAGAFRVHWNMPLGLHTPHLVAWPLGGHLGRLYVDLYF